MRSYKVFREGEFGFLNKTDPLAGKSVAAKGTIVKTCSYHESARFQDSRYNSAIYVIDIKNPDVRFAVYKSSISQFEPYDETQEPEDDAL